MASPFPGMDPYLESPVIWPDVHNRLIFAIADQLQPSLSPQYTAVITPYSTADDVIEIAQPRLYIPDIGITETSALRPPRRDSASAVLDALLIGMVPMDVPQQYRHIEIRTAEGDVLVTMIEVLSPANKRAGYDHAEAYNRKRRDVLSSTAHLLEIDLLRAGLRPALTTALPDAPYFVFLSRAPERPRIHIWPIILRVPLPSVWVPLLPSDSDVALDLQAALHRIYESARYDLRIDERADPPLPALHAKDAAWLAALLHAAGLRESDE